MKDLLGSSLEDIIWLSSKDVSKEQEKVTLTQSRPQALQTLSNRMNPSSTAFFFQLKRADFLEFFPGWVMSDEERNVFYESASYITFTFLYVP